MTASQITIAPSSIILELSACNNKCCHLVRGQRTAECKQTDLSSVCLAAFLRIQHRQSPAIT